MDLIERAARAICDGVWDAASFVETANGESPEEQREYWRDIAGVVLHVAFTIPTDPTESDRQRYQALCDALDAAGYRPTGWVEPERLK